MAPVIIYGAGGLGGEVLDILLQQGEYEPVAFLDSAPRLRGTALAGLPVLGGPERIEALLSEGISRAVVAIGDNIARATTAEMLEKTGLELVSAIHPLASLSPSARLGRHLIIAARATLCVHASVGAHAVICAGAIAEHDNTIGTAAFLGPAVRLAGGVHVGDFARLEIGASVIPGRRVGRGAVVRAGAVVIHDVPECAEVGGVPAERASAAAGV